MPSAEQAVTDAPDRIAAPPRTAAVLSVGVAVPEQVVANAEVATRIGVTERWIETRTGVRRRHVARPEERLQDIATAAARSALLRAGIDGAELDLVLVATMAADELTPNAAPLVAHDVGAVHAGAFDVGAACTGFLTAVAMAAGQIESNRCERALVVGVDLLSRLTDPDDRGTAALFADGAGAVVLGPSDGCGWIGPVVLGADGGGAPVIRASHTQRYIHMQGHDTFREAVRRLSEVALEAVARAGRHLEDIDLFVFHQANGRILTAVAERLGLPAERVVDCIDVYGNTSSATIPIALDVAAADGRLKEGSTVVLAAFGAGFTWGATVVEWA